MMTGTIRHLLGHNLECGETRATPLSAGRRGFMTGLAAMPVIAACSPTVRIEAPTEPIEINLNVRIRIDRELDELFDEEDDIF